MIIWPGVVEQPNDKGYSPVLTSKDGGGHWPFWIGWNGTSNEIKYYRAKDLQINKLSFDKDMMTTDFINRGFKEQRKLELSLI